MTMLLEYKHSKFTWNDSPKASSHHDTPRANVRSLLAISWKTTTTCNKTARIVKVIMQWLPTVRNMTVIKQDYTVELG